MKYTKACELNENEVSLAIKLEEFESARDKVKVLTDLEMDIAALGENENVIF